MNKLISNIVGWCIFLAVVGYNGYNFWKFHTDSGATYVAKGLINDSIKELGEGIKLNDLVIEYIGNYEDAKREINTKDKLGSSGTFYRGLGTFSDGEEKIFEYVCYYRYRSGGDDYIIASLCNSRYDEK